MESQLHRHYDDVHDEQEHAGETKSAMKKVKEKVEKFKDTIKHGHGHHEDDDTKTVNDSPPVRSGMVQPTVMGTPVLAEDLYATHSDIVDPPMRTFGQWEEEEERHGAPPPLSTGMYGSHPTNVNTEQIEQLEADRSVPKVTTAASPANNQTKVTDPTNTGGKEAGITDVLKSFDKLGIYDESYSKSSDPNDPEVYTGSHDQFAPANPIETPPPDTVAGNPSNPTSSYAQKVASAAAAAKDRVVSKLGFSGENKPEKNPPSFSPNDFAHKVADTMTGTFVPVYDTVVGAKTAVVSKIQGSGDGDGGGGSPAVKSPEGKKVTVREYLVDSFRPGDEDKVLSEKITNVFHRGKGNNVPQDDEGERRLQDSSN